MPVFVARNASTHITVVDGRYIPDVSDAVTDCIPASDLHQITGGYVSAACDSSFDAERLSGCQQLCPVGRLLEESVDLVSASSVRVQLSLC